MADAQRLRHQRRGKADQRHMKSITMRAKKALDGTDWACPHCGTRVFNDVKLKGGDLDGKTVRICRNKHAFRMTPKL